MTRFEDQIRTKIAATNRANEVANELFPIMRDIFAQFVGKQVCKVDGGFLKKVCDLLPVGHYPDKFPQPTVMYYRNKSEYTVSFTVKVCASCAGEGCAYSEKTFYVADLSNGVIREDGEKYESPECRTDWTYDELQALREDHKAKKEIADKALNALYPFGA